MALSYPSVAFRSEQTPVVRKELDQMTAGLQTWLSQEHHADGTHGALTADSVTADRITSDGALTADSIVTTGGITTTGGSIVAMHGNLNANAIGSVTGYYEGTRPAPLGHWRPVPFNAAHFTASGATWTVGSAAVLRNRVSMVGQTVLWGLYVSWFSGSNDLTAPAAALQVTYAPPPGYPAIAFDTLQIQGGIYGFAGGALIDYVAQPSGDTIIQFTKKDGSNLLAGAAGFIVNLVLEVR